MKTKCLGWVSLVLILCACNSYGITPTMELTSTPAPVPTLTPAPSIIPLTEAQQYLSDALDIMQENAYYRDRVDWASLRPKLITAAQDAESPADTYNIIQYVLEELDRHSQFMTPEDVQDQYNSTASDSLAPSGKLIDGRLGYIALYGFMSFEDEERNKHADLIQNILIDLSEQAVCGWIVDLRYNSGGSLNAMIGGLGALAGEGLMLSGKDAKGQTRDFYYQNGQIWVDDKISVTLSQPEFILDPVENPVAILIGSKTVSAGEFTAISFRGRPNTKFFGKPTWGLPTFPVGFLLSDGALLLVTTSIGVDRTGQEYSDSIIPDIITSSPQQDAVDWLLAQTSCTEK